MSVADQVKLGDKPEEDLLILTHIAEDAERYEGINYFPQLFTVTTKFKLNLNSQLLYQL